MFIVSHLLLNQLRAFYKYGSHFGMAMIKYITNYTLPEYMTAKVLKLIRKFLDYIDGIVSTYRILNA